MGFGKRTFGEFGRVVGHHADGEGEASRRDENAGEGRIKHVWVASDGVVEAGNAEID